MDTMRTAPLSAEAGADPWAIAMFVLPVWVSGGEHYSCCGLSAGAGAADRRTWLAAGRSCLVCWAGRRTTRRADGAVRRLEGILTRDQRDDRGQRG